MQTEPAIKLQEILHHTTTSIESIAMYYSDLPFLWVQKM